MRWDEIDRQEREIGSDNWFGDKEFGTADGDDYEDEDEVRM